MVRVDYKPLSVNEVWQGKRFKTKAYQNYEQALLYILPPILIPSPPYKLTIEFGMSALSDIDNPIKPFLDILQKKYNINDRNISELNIKKTVVKKGNEYIKFSINEATH